jgi:hypothetical protein
MEVLLKNEQQVHRIPLTPTPTIELPTLSAICITLVHCIPYADLNLLAGILRLKESN